MQAIQAAVQLAKNDKGAPVALTVVDANGITIGAVTMDNAPARVVKIAHAKAYTAAKMMVSTETFLKKLRDEKLESEWFCDDNFSALPGGIPVYVDDVCVCAVGVSGRSLDDDVKLATTFAESLRSSLLG